MRTIGLTTSMRQGSIHISRARIGLCPRRCRSSRKQQRATPRPTFTPSLPALSRNAQKNVDASVDIYFGPQAPQGKESNWVPTKPGGQFEILFRLYGPERLWRLIARVVKEAHAAADWSEVCSLAIDETSSRRGRWYVTVFLDAETHRLLYVAARVPTLKGPCGPCAAILGTWR